MNQKKIIEVKDLVKTYKTSKRNPGILNAIKALFSKEYEIKDALKGISFEVKQGEILGFIGPNGAGKSTTIKALSGVLFPTSGSVRVLDFNPWKDRIRYVQHIGVVFGQKPQLWWDLPAMDSFYLHKEIYQIPEKEFEKRLDSMIRRMGVEDIVKKPVRDLSLGERMKCKLIAALLHNPKLVFLDEPSIGLDIIAKNTMRDFIIEMNQKFKTTFIITTHDMQEIERLCERIIIINDGSLIYDGPIKEIKDEYQRKKVIDVKLESKTNKFKLKDCRVIQEKDYELSIEVNTGKISVKKVIDYLLKEYDVADININDPPIEEIIEEMFKK